MVDDELRERFFTEAPQAWEAYRDFWASFVRHETLYMARTTTQSDSVESYQKRQFLATSDSRMVVIEETSSSMAHGESQRASVYGENPHYRFELSGPALKQLKVSGLVKQEDAVMIVGPGGIDRWWQYSAPLFVGSEITDTLEGLVASPLFVLEEIRPATYRDHSLIEIKFVAGAPRREIRGTALLDPDRSWMVRQFDVTESGANSGSMHYRSEFLEVNEQFAFPIYRELKWFTTGTVVRGQESYEIEVTMSFTLDPTPAQRAMRDHQFSLSAFELPEPDGVVWPDRRTGWPWQIWLGIAAVAILFTAMVLRRLSSRGRRLASSG